MHKPTVYTFARALIVLTLVLGVLPVHMATPDAAYAQAGTDLVITGVIDGPLTGGIPKAIELYVVNDIPDLSIFGVGSANNGGGSDGQEFTFPAVAATAGSFIYVATEAVAFTTFFGFAPDYISATAASINGDDAIELFELGTVIDVFGDINVDGSGTPWDYLDGWAYRNNNTGPDGSTFVLANWYFSGINALDGETDNASAAIPFPIGTYQRMGGGDAAPTVTGTVPADGATGVALDADIDITFSEGVNFIVGAFNISCDISGTHTYAYSYNAGTNTATLDPDVNFVNGDVCTVTVYAANVMDADADDPPDNMAADYVFTFRAPYDICADMDYTPIYDIQGNGPTTPLDTFPANEDVYTRGVVTADFQDDDLRNGFFIQDPIGDGDPATADGIFVYENQLTVDVNVGDEVAVIGDVTEYNGLTEISAKHFDADHLIVVCGTGAVGSTTVNLPIPDDGTTVEEFWEPFEGMYVTIPQTLTVTDNYYLARYGQALLVTGERLLQYTQTNAPDVAGYADYLDAIALRSIMIDDRRSVQNPDPVIFPDPELAAGNTLRTGATITGLTGVVNYTYGDYVIEPVDPVGDPLNFVDANPRPAGPPAVGGMLTVASFNVLNFFTTLDDGVNDICGPAGDMECRGADSPEEYQRQLDKLLAALVGLDADIVGLIEIENHATDVALATLVNELNAVMGAGTYDYIATGPIGTDAIKVALIYKPGTVTPTGAFAILDSTVDPLFLDTKNRPALAQTFTANANDAVFTVVVNHFKSKGSACNDVGDPDLNDGQGNCPQTRLDAATALANWLDTDPTGSGDPDFLILGDFNSYAMEPPIAALEAAGYLNLGNLYVGNADAYSYSFDGQWGTLDYGLATLELIDQIVDVHEWHINADEPVALDYNEEYKSAGQIISFFNGDEFRASDHDPIVIGLALDTPPVPPVEEPGEPGAGDAGAGGAAGGDAGVPGGPTGLPSTGYAPQAEEDSGVVSAWTWVLVALAAIGVVLGGWTLRRKSR